ncbi:thioredoxin peroxidase [Saccharomycopsis crataegensis]|uniref:thioredoxin-dependent peroxiredoxin n=1 Tax=Saccharomycopsis crataegensis TaxID=43959 RepID=A0AAV5QGE9_9ASCO|nr:thioredoxin peroxidase [Saccharomycopsis crataegensis]
MSSSVRRSSRLASKHKLEEPAPSAPAKKPKSSKKTAVKPEEKPEKKPANKALKIDDAIPDIVLKNQDDEDVSLKQIASENRIVAIFAYPKASTPGCTKQACGFSQNYGDLSKKAKIFGLSSDSPKAQKNFMVKQSLKLDGLLCDPEKKLIGPLGAKKSPNGIKRSHWIFVDGYLKVSRVQISPLVSVDEAKEEIEEIYSNLTTDEEPKKDLEESDEK